MRSATLNRPVAWRALRWDQAFNRLTWVVCLSGLAFLGNRFDIPITFGTNFIFGSIATMIAAVCLGWPEAACVALVGSLATIPLWNHFGYVMIAVLEALFVATTYRRFWNNAVVATSIYWFLPGVLVFAAVYGLGLHVDLKGQLFLWSKLCVNSIFNALIASGILTLLGIVRLRSAKIPLQQAFFNTLVAVIFIPILIIVVFTSQTRMKNIEKEIALDLRDQARTITQFLTLWREQNIDAVESIAQMAQERDLKSSFELQKDLHLIHLTHPSFYDVFVANAQAVTYGFDPPVSPKGEQLIGLSFRDRQYFKDVLRLQKPLVSDVLLGRGGIDFPIICFIVPTFTKGPAAHFAGFALGSYDVRDLAKTLELLLSDRSFRVTISDKNGTIITSTDERIQPLSSVSQYFEYGKVPTSETSYQRSPRKPSSTASYQKWRETVRGAEIVIPSLGWTIHLETDLGRYTQDIDIAFIQSFGQMVALTLVGVGFSFLILVWISDPIKNLATLTTNVAVHPLESSRDSWPASRIEEVAALIQNFSAMTTSLRERFTQLGKEIDERKSAEKKLLLAMQKAQEANVAKSAFLANMSHEIRTPLAAIIGYTELLKINQTSQEEKATSIDTILRNSSQLSQLVNDILDLSKIEAGHLQVQPTWVSIDDVVASGVEALRCRAEDKGLKLQVEGSGEFPPRIWIDPTRLNQIVLNIVGNAIKFTEKGQITVCFSIYRDAHDPTRATMGIMVKDTGVGIAPQIQANLFQPFVQGDATYSRRFGGTGLGLALSRNIATALGGYVDLRESIAGVGSIFEIKIPVKIDSKVSFSPSLEAARAAVKSPIPKPLKKSELYDKKILLVEDSPDNRILVTRMLTLYGASVTGVSSGEEALEFCEKNSWDTVLMDMQMPGMDGFDATKELRRRGYKRPIIALTAHALPEEKERCFAVGCNDHVTKPVNWPALISAIQKWQ